MKTAYMNRDQITGRLAGYAIEFAAAIVLVLVIVYSQAALQ